MKSAIAVMLAAVLALALAGCGGGGEGDAGGGLSLLMESSQAMMEVSGYRMRGTIEMDMGGSAAGGTGQALTMELTAEVQNEGGETRQHMFINMGGYEVEAYIIGGVYYQLLPEQGWTKTSSGAYMGQSVNLGMMSAEQMRMMADTAKSIEVVEEGEGVALLTYSLDRDYMQRAMDIYRDYAEEQNEELSPEWLRMAEEAMSDFQAELRIWINQADKLIRRMEMSYSMGGMSEIGKIRSTMEVEIFDYGADINVELPAEAAEAEELPLPS